jgi:soluble lytic murein transglycosylase-like protein
MLSQAWARALLLLSLLGSAGAVSASSPEIERLLDRAKRFEYGVGAPQDLDQAIDQYCQASALGNVHAKYQLGWLYLTGRLGKVDQVLAAAWFQEAAREDHAASRQKLIQLDALDRSIPQQAECVSRQALQERFLPRRRASSGANGAARPSSLPPGIKVRKLVPSDIMALVQRLAPEYGLDPALVLALIEVESNFNPNARSPKNAQGLMQLIPATAERFDVTNVWEPLSNLRGGMRYLQWLLNHFDGDLSLALAGYNAGENAVKRHGGIPPYPETQAYVKRVLGKYRTRLSRPTRVGVPGQEQEQGQAYAPEQTQAKILDLADTGTTQER